MNRRKFAHRLLATTVALTLAGCGSGDKGGKKKIKLAFVTNAPSDFWVYAQAGIAAAEKELGDVQAIYKVGTGDQRTIIQDLLVSGVKGVAFSPTAPKDQKDMINTWSESAQVICVDSDAPESNRLLYIGTDNVAAGRQCGELVKEALPDGGKIMVFVGIGDQLNAVQRFTGLKEALDGSNIEILGLRTDEAKEEVARRNAEDTLVKHSDISGMIGLWSYNAPQILAAVKDAGKVGQVKIIGFDEDPVTLKAIDEGEIYATICQQPYVFGYESIKLLHSLTVGGKKVAELEHLPENRQIMVPTVVVKKDGALDYLAKCNAWKAEIRK